MIGRLVRGRWEQFGLDQYEGVQRIGHLIHKGSHQSLVPHYTQPTGSPSNMQNAFNPAAVTVDYAFIQLCLPALEGAPSKSIVSIPAFILPAKLLT